MELIPLSPSSDAGAPVQMDSPSFSPPEGTGEGGNKKKWIIIAVVVVLLLCCCCLIVAVALSWEDIADALDDMLFQIGPGLAWLQSLTA